MPRVPDRLTEAVVDAGQRLEGLLNDEISIVSWPGSATDADEIERWAAQLDAARREVAGIVANLDALDALLARVKAGEVES